MALNKFAYPDDLGGWTLLVGTVSLPTTELEPKDTIEVTDPETGEVTRVPDPNEPDRFVHRRLNAERVSALYEDGTWTDEDLATVRLVYLPDPTPPEGFQIARGTERVEVVDGSPTLAYDYDPLPPPPPPPPSTDEEKAEQMIADYGFSDAAAGRLYQTITGRARPQRN